MSNHDRRPDIASDIQLSVLHLRVGAFLQEGAVASQSLGVARDDVRGVPVETVAVRRTGIAKISQ